MISPKTIEQALGEMQSLRDCLRWSVSSFLRAGLHYGHGTDNAWDEARWLVLGALALPFDSPEWVLDARVATPERERLAQLLKRADGALYVAKRAGRQCTRWADAPHGTR